MKNNIKYISIAVIFMISVLSVSSCENKGAVTTQAGTNVSSEEASSSAPAYMSLTDSSPNVIEDFVRVTDLDSSIVVDMRYATKNNFTHKKVYPTNACVLRLETAKKLANANAELKTMGYRIKVWDAYRPFSVQKIFWSIKPDTDYVANPLTGGSIHNRGCAVDVTMVDENGKEVEMPSGFDDFTEKAYRSNSSMTSTAANNLKVLTKVMVNNGFLCIDTEWWHYEDSDSEYYKNADVDLALFK